MLQSEYDAIMRRKRLKIFLIILVTATVAGAFFVIIKVGREKFMTPRPTPETTEIKENTSSQEEVSQSGTSGNISTPLTPEEISAYENAAKEAGSVQQQVSTGTLSAEEARDRLREIGKSIPVPPPPPEVKK